MECSDCAFRCLENVPDQRVALMAGFDLEVQSDQRAVQSARRSHGAGAGRRAGLGGAAAVVVLRHGREGRHALHRPRPAPGEHPTRNLHPAHVTGCVCLAHCSAKLQSSDV